MSNFCSCTQNPLNTGAPSGAKTVAVAAYIYAVRLKNDSGTANSIASTDTIDQAYLQANISNPNPSQRWYPIGNFLNVTDDRAEPNTESFSDGTSAITTQGTRSFSGWLINASAAYLGKINSFACSKFGIYIVDVCGNLAGSISADGTKLYPVAVNNSTWNALLVKKSDGAAGKVQLNFEYSQLESDKNLRQILRSEMAADVDFRELTGLIDIAPAIASSTTTEMAVALTVNFDGFLNPEKVSGFSDSDFTLYNNTTASAVTVVSATEAPVGTYTLTYAAQTAGDVLRLSGIAQGYEIASTTATVTA